MTPRAPLSGLNGKTYDLLVVGGGINGAGIAREAALSGLSVLLVEKRDWAWGTSSRSTKLVHGGLRYLENFQMGLVFESSRERRLLAGRLAPHLVRPLRILLPICRGDARGSFWIRCGLWLYDLLALFGNVHRHEFFSAKAGLKMEPGLDPRGLKALAATWDCQMNDARLTWENVLAARASGAECRNYTTLAGLPSRRRGGVEAVLEDGETGDTAVVKARLLVNATGPWVDRVLKDMGWADSRKVRPSKGIHILVPGLTKGNGLLVSAKKDNRVFFILPFALGNAPVSLIGTTDTDFEGDLDALKAGDDEIQYLLDEANRLFPGAALERSSVLASFAGVRPLAGAAPPGKGSPVSARREAMLHLEEGVLSVTGGKFTTYRSLGRKVVRRACRAAGLKAGPSLSARLPLPGAPEGELWANFEKRQVMALAGRWGLKPEQARWVLGLYGRMAGRVLRLAEENHEWLRPLDPARPDLQAEVVWAVRHEDARRLDDFFLRRSFLGLGLKPDSPAPARAAELMGRELGWDAARGRQEVARLKGILEGEYGS